MATFGYWLQSKVMNDSDVEDELYVLARTPSSTILTFKGYEINGNTFYMIAQDKKASTKIVVSASMQETIMGKRTHIMVT